MPPAVPNEHVKHPSRCMQSENECKLFCASCNAQTNDDPSSKAR